MNRHQMRGSGRTGADLGIDARPAGFAVLGIFWFFGAVVAILAGTSLFWRGTPLDRIWALNPRAYRQLAPLGASIGVLFLLLGVALVTAGLGWFRRRLWGWRMAVAIIATQIIGDGINFARGEMFGGGIGVIVAGALLLFLLQPKLRAQFR